MPSRALIFQHMPHDSPGRFGDYLMADGFDLHVVNLGKGEPIPALDKYDFLMVLGGEMNVWEEAQYPWLALEKRAIAQWVRQIQRPYLGVCLGHQLLAESLGGEVGRSKQAEIGLSHVHLRDLLEDGFMRRGLPTRVEVGQWHHSEVVRAPIDGTILAASESTPIQGLRVGSAAIGLQFHAEWTPEVIRNWQHEPGHMEAYEAECGQGAYGRLLSEAPRIMDAYERLGRLVYATLMDRQTAEGGGAASG